MWKWTLIGCAVLFRSFRHNCTYLGTILEVQRDWAPFIDLYRIWSDHRVWYIHGFCVLPPSIYG